MLNAIFPLLDGIDGALAGALPPVIRICLWGILSGALTMGIYALLSPQKLIRRKKDAIRVLQRRAMSEEAEFKDVLAVSRKNLTESLSLLALVLLPALISALPVVASFYWLDARYSYAPLQMGEVITIKYYPPSQAISIMPADLVKVSSTGEINAIIDTARPFEFMAGGEVIYKGPPAQSPASNAHKRTWMDAISESPVGYLSPASPVEAILFGLKSHRIISFGPEWMATWEFTYFLILTISAIAIKVVFKIE